VAYIAVIVRVPDELDGPESSDGRSAYCGDPWRHLAECVERGDVTLADAILAAWVFEPDPDHDDPSGWWSPLPPWSGPDDDDAPRGG